jgi:hypothetical protein
MTNGALDLMGNPAFQDVVWLGHCFKAVTLPYLLLIRILKPFIEVNLILMSIHIILTFYLRPYIMIVII